jgi:hypothetical protein
LEANLDERRHIYSKLVFIVAPDNDQSLLEHCTIKERLRAPSIGMHPVGPTILKLAIVISGMYCLCFPKSEPLRIRSSWAICVLRPLRGDLGLELPSSIPACTGDNSSFL